MSVWNNVVGQPEAVATLTRASADSMTHAWLITGPPGSGRSLAAYAFAASLLCPNAGCGTCADCQQVAARTHPDLSHLATERVIISIDEVRELVQRAYYSPSVARYRVIVIEDADRMAERTSNVLLKALEEPPERTVWVLCAPSEADLIPTIRSRVRSVRLRVPNPELVAELLVDREGVTPANAQAAARLAQSHIGMATRLATNSEAAARRAESVQRVLAMRGVHDAVMTAARLHEIATEDGKALTEERDAAEMASARASAGLSDGDTIPPALRSYFRTLEEQQKRRSTRSLRDGLDRILVDLLSVYRDVLRLQLGIDTDIINLEFEAELQSVSSARTPGQTIATMAAIDEARARIAANVSPVLALEAMLCIAVSKDAS